MPSYGSSMISLVQSSGVGYLTVDTNSISDCGTYIVTMAGHLIDPNTGATFATSTVSFNVIILSTPSHDYIVPSMLSPLTYQLGDPMLIVALPPSTSSTSLPVTYYTLKNADDSAPKSPLISFSNLQLTVSSSDPADVGQYYLTLSSFFNPLIAYHESKSFILTVNHYCQKSSIFPMPAI